MKKTELYKRFKLNAKNAKPGDLMKAASKRKSQGKGFPQLHKKHKDFGLMQFGDRSIPHGSTTQLGGAQGNAQSTSMGANPRFFKGSKKRKVHTKNDHDADDKHKSHRKGLKLVPPSKGHKPKGARGRAAVAQLGRTKTTGNFARIEASKGKGAAIAAFQNARRAHKGK